jgi:serine protease Do
MMGRVVTAALLLLAGATAGISETAHAKNPLQELSGSIRDLTRRVAPAVVEIVVTAYSTSDDAGGQAANQISRQRSSGSGVIVDSSGYIMTNAHVVEGAVRTRVLLPGSQVQDSSGSPSLQNARTVDARIVGIDRESDLALLKIEGHNLPVLGFGDSDKLQQGDLVFAVGSPLGLQNSVSMGVVSAPARAINNDNPILYIQTDASINPGNSGGALVDTNGAVIGLNTFIVSQSGGNEGIGFALPSNVVANVYHQLRKSGHVSRGYLGVVAQDITPVIAKGLMLPAQRGVVVADVTPDGPADRAGLKRRDVVVNLNGQPVQSARQLENEVFRRRGGDKIELTILRGDDRLSVPVEIQEQSAPWDPLAALASPEKNLIPRLGILCIEIDKKVAQVMPDLRRHYGLIVAAKSPEGQAQFIDLQPGDIIHAVNNLPVSSLSAFQQTIAEMKTGDAVVLQIERDQQFQYVGFELE